MLASIIGLILTCIVLGVILWAAQKLVALIPLAEPFQTIIKVLFVLILVLIVIWFLTVLLGFAGVHVPAFSGLNFR